MAPIGKQVKLIGGYSFYCAILKLNLEISAGPIDIEGGTRKWCVGFWRIYYLHSISKNRLACCKGNDEWTIKRSAVGLAPRNFKVAAIRSSPEDPPCNPVLEK